MKSDKQLALKLKTIVHQALLRYARKEPDNVEYILDMKQIEEDTYGLSLQRKVVGNTPELIYFNRVQNSKEEVAYKMLIKDLIYELVGTYIPVVVNYRRMKSGGEL